MRRPLLLVVGVLLACLAALPLAGQEERTPASRLKALKAERLAARPQAATSATVAKTVVVNCARHGSISTALANHPGPVPLVIEVRGTCKENVLIERNDVTLRGSDPLLDGIQGVTADPQPVAALDLNYANRIVIENIFVRDSPSLGVRAMFSAVQEMRNCRIVNNAGNGITISFASALTGTGLVVSGNAGSGIFCQRQGWVTCEGCRLEDNAGTAATSRLGGFMTLWDSVVSGGQGISAVGAGSYVDVDCVAVVSDYPCSVNVQKNAAQASGGGEAALWGVGAFSGRVSASDNGGVGIFGGQQTLPTGVNQITDSSRLTTGMAEDTGPATKLGSTHLGRFSRATLYDATELSGNLTCDSGADAWSDTPYPAAQVSGCTKVPTTP